MGSPGNRNHHIFALADGTIIYNRSLNTYDIVSAAGVIEIGNKYIITIRQNSTTGMELRVNGIQVAVDAGETAANVDFVNPRIGIIDDQITGGVGRVIGEKRWQWVSAHSGAATDFEVAQMESYLATRFGIPGFVPNAIQPAIANQETEYDIAVLSGLGHEDIVATWDDSSGNANDATAVGSPKYEDGAWDPAAQECCEFLGTGAELVITDGTPFVAADEIIVFVVFRVFDQSVNKAITGGASFTAFRMMETFIRDTGSLVWSFGAAEGPTLAVESGTGEIIADGTCYVCAFIHSNVEGKKIRKAIAGAAGDFGIEIASLGTPTGNLVAWDGPTIADIADVVHADQFQLAWFSAHLAAPDLPTIQQMETWLLETFCGQSSILSWPRDILPEQVTSLATPGAVKRRTIAGLVQIRSITAIGWVWEEIWGLLRVTEKDHMNMLAFTKRVWHSGEPFLIRHLLMPGSGIPPNGVGTLNVMVAGAAQTGPQVVTDGWPASTAAVVVVGDVISIQGEPAVYMVTETADSDGAGVVTIKVNPPLRTSPADNAIVKTTDVQFLAVIMGRSKFEPTGAPTSYSGLKIRVEECLL
jgi:hypothetical protein